MNRYFHNVSVGIRQAVLSLILLVPARWRAALSENTTLVRCYEFFDRSKYEQIQDAGQWADSPEDRSKSFPHSDYTYWSPALTKRIRAKIEGADGPLFSIVMPVYNTDPEWLALAIESVCAQWYPHWELCIVDDHSDRTDTRELLESMDDPRIRIQRLPENLHIAKASNAGIAMAKGDFIGLLDHDDELTPDALYRVWDELLQRDADFVFSDEDKLDEEGRFCEPHFKPDFSPAHFLSQNYLCHFSVLRRSLVEDVGGFSEGVDGAQDYDLFLKIMEKTDRIAHVPRVLYHWRKVPGSTAGEFTEKSYAGDAGRRALQSAMDRRGIDARAESGPNPGTYRVHYAIQGEPLVSIIIPFCDKPDLLNTCLTAILEHSTWSNFEVIGISNNSRLPETVDAMRSWSERDERIRFICHDVPFNYSSINNFAVREHANGEHVVLMNNDIEVISPDWIESLLEHSQQPSVGVVGSKLLYPDATVQHAGVIVGLGGVAGHSHKHFHAEDPGYKYRPHIIQNLSAVTAALCMVKRSIYEAVGGLDEDNFRVAFNDVDFCLRVVQRGYLNVYTPHCEAWHHESSTRGYEDNAEKQRRFWGEIERFKSRHRAYLAAGDPYYNENLNISHENFELSTEVARRRREEALDVLEQQGDQQDD